jgi:hypothetical protein
MAQKECRMAGTFNLFILQHDAVQNITQQILMIPKELAGKAELPLNRQRNCTCPI